MENFNYSVKTKLRSDKLRKDGTCPIVLQVIINSKIIKLSLKGESIKPKYWDFTYGRAKGKGYNTLNILIDRQEQSLKDFIRIEITDKGSTNLKIVKNFWNGTEKINKDDFYIFYKDFCKRKKELGEIRESTFRHYITLERKLKSFRKSILFSEIDIKFMTEFYIFLERTNSGRYNMIKFLKCALRDAENFELTKTTSWKSIKNPQKSSKVEFLSKNDILTLKKLDLSEQPVLEEVRNMFLFSCYTGLRHSDVIRLKKSNFKNGIISFKQHKTSVDTITPIVCEAKNMIEKYFLNTNDTDTIFHPYTNSYTNRQLKKIIFKADLNRDFSYHISRHTFASTLLHNKVDSVLVSKMMGHKKPLQTFNYMHTNANLMKDSMETVKFT